LSAPQQRQVRFAEKVRDGEAGRLAALGDGFDDLWGKKAER
jgi:hypothetical protein